MGSSVMGKNQVGVSSRENERKGMRDHFVKRGNKLIGTWMKRNVGSGEVCNFFL